jgi:enoyl-CoA hydratase/carnithine racemase
MCFVSSSKHTPSVFFGCSWLGRFSSAFNQNPTDFYSKVKLDMLQSLHTLCGSSYRIAWRFSSWNTSPNVGTISRCIHSYTLWNTMHENKDAVSATPEVLHDQRGQLAVVTLNRPKALNSLTTRMVESILSLLRHWESSDIVAAVLVKGAGGKAFCAGGDVKAIAQLGRSGDTSAAQRFFRSEYRMNAAIAAFPKPYIAIIDGITMGGGAGVSVHGPIRIATEKTLFAMPECAIGLFPDIGGSYFLPRLPGAVGMYLGLTGARLKGVDVLHAGIATHYVPSALLPEVEKSLEGLGSAATSLHKINEVLNDFQRQEPLPDGTLPSMRDDIDAIFGGQCSVEGIYRACERRQGQLGQEVLELLQKYVGRFTWF